ncbi:hypothetical protein EV363DRAFT_1164070, partial [Boletus edulis]
QEAGNGKRKCTPLPLPRQCDLTLQGELGLLEPDSPSLFKTLATGGRRFRRGSTTTPPVTFFCTLRIAISARIAGLIDHLAFLSSFGVNRLRSCDTLIPMVFGEVVGGQSWDGLNDDTWRSIKLASMAIDEVVASLDMIVGTPGMYKTSAHVPFVGLLILDVPSDPAVVFAELGEGAMTAGGDDRVGELEPIVDDPHESVSTLESPDLGVAAVLGRF